MPLGVKKTAWLLSGSLCPHYKPVKHHKWKRVSKKHARTVEIAKKKFLKVKDISVIKSALCS